MLALRVGADKSRQLHRSVTDRFLDANCHPQPQVVIRNVRDRARQQLSGCLVEKLVWRHEVPQLHRDTPHSGFNKAQRCLVNHLIGIDVPVAANRL